MAMKHCSKCFEVLPENDMHFVKRKVNKSGLGAHCLGCEKSRKQKYLNNNKEKNKSKKSKYYKDNKEEIKKKNKVNWHKNRDRYLARKKEYYEKNKNEILSKNKVYRIMNDEIIKERRFIYRKNNKQKIAKANKIFYQKNKDLIKKRVKNWVQDNPEKRRANNLIYVQRKRSLISNFSFYQWQQCLTHFNHQCAYCGSTESLEQEHVIPVSRGGHYTPDNIIPACRSCNASKNNKIMQDWFTQNENYSVERMANILKYVQKNKTEVNI